LNHPVNETADENQDGQVWDYDPEDILAGSLRPHQGDQDECYNRKKGNPDAHFQLPRFK
jgi:hypothetical protein